MPSYALLDAQIDTWYAEANGNFSESPDRAADLRDDFGLTEGTEAVGAAIAFGLHHQAYADSLSISLDGSASPSDSYGLSSFNPSPGSYLKSELNISSFSAGYRFEAGSDILRMGFMAGLQQFEIDLELNPGGGPAWRRDSNAILPTLGIFASGHPLPFANFKAAASIGEYDFDGDKSSSFKLELQLLMEIPPGFYLGFGYRHLELVHEKNDFNIDATLQGPVAFLGFRL